MTTATTTAIRANALHILIVASVMMSLAMGMRQCLGLFLPPMTQALANSASDFTFAIAVQNIVLGLAQAPLGAWPIAGVASGHGAGGDGVCSRDGGHDSRHGRLDVRPGADACRLRHRLHGILAGDDRDRARRLARAALVGAFSSVGTLVIAPVLQGLLGVWDWRWGAVLFVILAVAMVPAAMVIGRVDRLPQASLPRVPAVAAEPLRYTGARSAACRSCSRARRPNVQRIHFGFR